jgi:thioredoxin reductase (NADPH)
VPVEIAPDHVVLVPSEGDGPRIRHDTDFVLLSTGFRGEQGLLELAGVELCGENRVPDFDPATMETNVPGLFVAGTAAAGIQQRYTLFIENCHDHAGKITQAITGRWPVGLGDAPPLAFEHIQAN